MLTDLKLAMDSLETKAGGSTVANVNEIGYWKRIAAAAETLKGGGTTANETMWGYMLRTAVALEGLSNTTGNEENATYHGYLKRIVDALEVKSGSVGTSTLEERFKVAATNAVFAVSYAAYALAEVFTTAAYWVGGTQYTPITTLPGYSFTRSGTQGAVDASGAVQWFAANVPAINSAGYHAYGALTNLVLQSQDFSSGTWIGNGATASANTTVAPDGTTTADTLTSVAADSGVYQLIATTSTAVYTTSTFFPAGGDVAYGYIQINTAGGVFWFTVNRTTGAVSAKQGAGVTGVAYSVAVGTGWRLVVVWTADAANINVATGLSDNGTTRLAAAGKTLPIWQYQTLLGNFPDGGPLIATAGATASIGASALGNTIAALTNVDQLIYVKVNALSVTGSPTLIELSDGTTTNIAYVYITGGNFSFGMNAAGVNALTGVVTVPFVAGVDTTLVFRRLSGAWRVGKVVAGVITWADVGGAGGMPVNLTNVRIGCSPVIGFAALSGKELFFGIKAATFATDASVIAEVA